VHVNDQGEHRLASDIDARGIVLVYYKIGSADGHDANSAMVAEGDDESRLRVFILCVDLSDGVSISCTTGYPWSQVFMDRLHFGRERNARESKLVALQANLGEQVETQNRAGDALCGSRGNSIGILFGGVPHVTH